MSWIVHVVIGLVLGIMFSVAYPDYTITINDAVEPTIRSLIDKAISFVIDFISMEFREI